MTEPKDELGNRGFAQPESVGQLAALDTLHLNQNQLTSLPVSIGQLAALERLHLYQN